MNIEPSLNSLNILKSIADKYLGDNVKVIFEFGARYCEDTIEFEKIYPHAHIYTFECNPKTLPICKERVTGKERITLIESAVGNYDGKIKFYPMNEEKTTTTWEDGNQGASSLSKSSGKYKVENYVQDEIEVPIIMLSTVMKKYSVAEINIMWMDIQGAELLALEGLEEKLKNVNIIHTEVEFMEVYKDQPLFEDVKRYLENNGFKFYGFTIKGEYAGDAVFINNRTIKRSLKNIFNWLKSTWTTKS